MTSHKELRPSKRRISGTESMGNARPAETKQVRCPGCGDAMKYKGNFRYECANPKCNIIEVKVGRYQATEIKEAAIL